MNPKCNRPSILPSSSSSFIFHIVCLFRHRLFGLTNRLHNQSLVLFFLIVTLHQYAFHLCCCSKVHSKKQDAFFFIYPNSIRSSKSIKRKIMLHVMKTRGSKTNRTFS